MTHNTHTKYKNLMSPTNDYIFCRLFGSNDKKHRLISLLNAILNGKPHIQDVTIDPNEYKKTQYDGKSIRLDINATTDDGTRINVEMQCVHTKDIFSRSEFNQAVLMRDETIKEGEAYDKIPKRIVIWFVEQNATNRKGCMHETKLMFEANGVDPVEVASDNYRLFIIELAKINKEQKQIVGEMFDAWMAFIKDPNNISSVYSDSEEIQDALDELEYLTHDDETRSYYNYRLREIAAINASNTEHYRDGMEKGLQQGLQEGLQQGMAEGAKQKAIETALNLLKAGIDINIVCNSTGLDAKEIEMIMNDIEATTDQEK